jgi:hypothetical protein
MSDRLGQGKAEQEKADRIMIRFCADWFRQIDLPLESIRSREAPSGGLNSVERLYSRAADLSARSIQFSPAMPVVSGIPKIIWFPAVPTPLNAQPRACGMLETLKLF